jgi:hypothetical protein
VMKSTAADISLAGRMSITDEVTNGRPPSLNRR